MLFNESDGVADLLSGIFLNVLVHMTQRRCELEHGDTVLKLHALGDNAVAEQRAVAGGVALNGAAAEDGRVVIDRNAGFRLGHGAYVACKAVFLSNVNVMYGRALVEQHGDIGGCDLAAEGNDCREAHHHRLHLVFVNEHDFLGKLLVVADAAVAAEELIKQLCNVLYDNILLCMADAQVLAAQALGVAIDHHGNRQIVCHPAIAEHCLYITGLYENDPEHVDPVIKPSGVVVQSIDNTAPLAAASVALALEVNITEIFRTDSLIGHHFTPPLIFLISTLSTNA